MTASNLKGTTDSFDGNSKENLASEGQVKHESTVDVNGTLDAKTGGQMNGGVVVQSGNRVEAENQNKPESSQGL
jgi:hypothetical protein